MTVWVLMSFLIAGRPFQVDEFQYPTQPSCALAMNKLGPSVAEFDLRCVKIEKL